MKKLILALLLFSAPCYAYQRGSELNEGDILMQKFAIQFNEVDSVPSCPPADEIKLYSKDSSGTTALFTLDSACSETELGAGGVGGSGDVTAVGDCTTGACFNGSSGTIITFNNAGGDKTLDYDGTDFLFNAPLDVTGDFDASGQLQSGSGNIVVTDATGNLDGSKIANADLGDFTFTSGSAAIDANAVALATDTTGNYVATIADSGNSTVTVANSGSENAAVTLNVVDVNCTNCLTNTEVASSDTASDVEGTDFGTLTDTKICTYDLANTEIDCASDPGGEINNLETITTGIATTEIPIGTAANTVVYAALSGQATMTNGGVVTVNDVTCTNCLTTTEVASADLATNVADADFGDVTVATGAWAVEDDSHAHTSTSISGLDVSADTNLTAGDNLTLTDDDLDLDSAVTIATSISSPIFSSTTADPADAGIVRFANAEGLAWEASPAGTDVTMLVDSSEIIQIANGTLDGGDLTSGTVTATQLGTDSVSADELNATGVESELESALDIAGDVSSTGMATTVIGADKVLESMLKAVDVAVDEDILTYENTTGDFEWHTCAQITGSADLCDGNDASAGSPTWDAIGDPAASATVAFGGTTQTISGNTNDVTAIDQDLLLLSFTNDAATDILTQRGILIQNEASTNGMEAFIALNNNDADDVVTSGLIINSGAGAITNALDVSDADIVTAISLGANDLTATNWSVAGATGTISTPTLTLTGTGTINGLDSIDDTSETTIESAIDTLANLTSVQGQTLTLAGSLITSGANSLTLTTTGATNVTLPTSGTLQTTTGTPAGFIIASQATGDMLYASSSTAWSRLATANQGSVLRVGASSIPAFGAVDLADADAVTGLLPTTNVASYTRRFSMMGSVIPDVAETTGDAFFEPYSILATNDTFKPMVLRLGSNNAAAPTVKSGVFGTCIIPKDFNNSGVTKVYIYWTSTLTTNNVVFDLDYRSITGNDTESLDQATFQESLTVTDTAPGAANRQLITSVTLTSSNLAADDIMEFRFGRDGADAADTLAGSALVFDLVFEYGT